MDHAGGAINPLSLIRRLPRGLQVPRLRDRIRAIVADFRTQSSLHEGCRAILDSDCIRLVARLYREARACARKVYVLGPDGTWQIYDSIGGRFEQVQGQNNSSSWPSLLPGEGRGLQGMRAFNDVPSPGRAGEGDVHPEADDKGQLKAGARKTKTKSQKMEMSVSPPLPSLIHF